MRKKILTIATCLTLGGFANAQLNVNIPDTNFKNALLAHGASAPVNGVNPITGAGISLIDANNDGDISTTEAQAYNGKIDVNNQNISDLTGIEVFVNVTTLFCYNNQLTSLDVSANMSLLALDCYNNQLSSLNVANGNNGASSSNLYSMRADGNPNLTCIQHDAGGFTPPAWTGPPFYIGWTKDATASWSTNCSGSSCANIVNIPDANFKNALINHSPTIDTDGDGEICQTEAQAYTGTINVFNKSISDLTGIEAFVNLTQLYCHNNQLTSVDVSANTALTFLNVNYNQLSSLDVSANTALTTLYCHNNQLTSLNVANGNNTNLNYMHAQNNPNLNCIQHDTGFNPTTATSWQKDATASWSDNCPPVSSCANIVNIPDTNFKNALLAHGTSITGAGISTIDTDGDGEICQTEAQAYNGSINVFNKNISDLTGIEAFTAITFLNSNNNQLTTLDLSSNSSLAQFYCTNNLLTYLNVANGNNSNMTDMWAQANNLSCIQHDSGFNPSSISNWVKDVSTSWSDNCPPVSSCTNIVNIPDANFKNALLAHGASAPVNGVYPINGTGISVIDTDGDGEICENEALAYTGTMNLNNQIIADLSGLEAFTNITTLSCVYGQHSSIDISANTALTNLQCGGNQLTNLDVSANTALTTLNCAGNQLTALNVSANTNLVELICSENTLNSLDVSANMALISISCEDNQITNLDVSANTALTELYCYSNQLTSLNVANGNNGVSSSNLYYMRADGNPNLTCIQHDTGFDPTTANQWTKDATASWSDNCGGGSTCTNIVNIPDANFKNALLAHGTSITALGVSVIDTDGDGEICQTEAQAYTGQIAVGNRNISDLTGIEAFVNITTLNCEANALTSLNVSANTALDYLHCANNQLSSLDVSTNTVLTSLGCTGNQLSSLDVSANSILRVLQCANNQLSSLNVANGNNGATTPKLYYMKATNNPNLTCIQHDTGFDPTTANWQKDATATWSNDCSGSININDIAFENLKVYPNPAKDILYIEVQEKLDAIQLIDLSGKVVKTFKGENKQLDIANITKGVYFLEIINTNKKSVIKVFVSH